jgi:peptide/nickel transport system substrate-binding protein
MAMWRRRSLGWLALGALSLALGACGVIEGERLAERASDELPAHGDTFILASIGDITALIPNIASDGSSHEVGSLIYDGLVQVDRNLTYAPQLAKSWTFSPDCLTLTFALRDDVKWHDGRPFTAEDVVFTYQAMVHPKTPTAYKDSFSMIGKVEALDPYTVRIEYTKPFARALSSWSMAMLPKHLLAPYLADGRLRESPQNRHPIGTGPYRFHEWRSGEKVVLLANRDYYDGPPYLGRVVYRVIPSQATIFLELKAQGVDQSSLTALQFTRQTDYPAFAKAFRKFRYPSNTYTFFGFNLRDPRFADLRVRRAFAHAINKQEIIDGVRHGLARAASGPIRPGTWAYTDDVRRYPYDAARARELLAEAGWKDRNGDGVIEDAEGRPFAFTIQTNQGNEERKKIAEIIQQRLEDVGVRAEIQVIEWASFVSEYLKKRRFDAVVMGFGVGTDPDQFVIWHSSQMGPDQMNRLSFANAEVDRLLEAGRASCHEMERVEYYQRFQQILAEEQPMIFLYFADALPAVTARVRGVEPAPAGISWNFTDWFVPEQLQRYTSG